MDATEVEGKLLATLRRFDTVMMATTADNGTIHARPMVVAQVDEAGAVWFVTSKDAEKLDEIRENPCALVTGQDDGHYVSLSGRLDVIHDRERCRALWKPAWNVWFPDGKDDPSIVLMRLTPEIGEYWDNRGPRGVRYLLEAAKALLRRRPFGDRVTDPRQHAKVPL